MAEIPYSDRWKPEYADLPNEAGEGSVTRRRRNPRMRVQDVEIAGAGGLALGGDGHYHPLEVTWDGELKGADRSVAAILEDVLRELRLIRMGLEVNGLLTNLDDGDDGA